MNPTGSNGSAGLASFVCPKPIEQGITNASTNIIMLGTTLLRCSISPTLNPTRGDTTKGSAAASETSKPVG
jgi:hypothetical protein